MNLRLNPDVQLDLKTNTGVGESDLDLTGLKVDRLVLHSGVGETRLAMLESNKTVCELIEVACGIGVMNIVGLGNFNFRKLLYR